MLEQLNRDVASHSPSCHSNSAKIISALSGESVAQPLADEIYFLPLTDHRFHIPHVKMSSPPLTFTNLKQNYSVAARGYEDKARGRRRERANERG